MKAGQKVVQYFKEAKSELMRVTWPSKKEATNHTLLVIGISLGLLIFFAIIDYILTLGLEQLIARN